jgi:cellulose synthase operon protein YhjQ
MEKRGTDKIDEMGVAETPEDVAVLYSWANLHGAKYRDFSASRREYRAQLRHRAAEQVRQQALLAQAEAEAAAEIAEAAAKKAGDAARTQKGIASDSTTQQNLRAAEEAARTAAAERVEAARRAEAAAMAEAAARREEREIAEAQASAQRQAARYAESEIRRREMIASRPFMPAQGRPGQVFEQVADQSSMDLPGTISDPYTPQQQHPPIASIAPSPVPTQTVSQATPPQAPAVFRQTQGYVPSQEFPMPQEPPAQRPVRANAPPPAPAPVQRPTAQVVESLAARGDSSSGSQRRPRGYHPDEASGVREIYRGPDYHTPQPDQRMTDSGRRAVRAEDLPPRERRSTQEPAGQPGAAGASSSGQGTPAGSGTGSSGDRTPFTGKRSTDIPPRPTPLAEEPVTTPWQAAGSEVHPAAGFDMGFLGRESIPGSAAPGYSTQMPAAAGRTAAQPPAASQTRPVSPFSQPPVQRQEPARGRRAHDDFGYQSATGYSDPSRLSYAEPQRQAYAEPSQRISSPAPALDSSTSRTSYGSDPAGPAWLYAPPSAAPAQPPQPSPLMPPSSQSSVAETLQHSRERVAARWFALKGVFEQPGQETVEPAPVRQKEIRTPVLAVFSLAGGVGKTSLVATIGRSLSSLGEKVLLTDTTSHGLLPFYFGASELRQGTVRTFSPPSGSTDAPIYLVSYEVDQKAEQSAQEALVEEIVNNSRGTHRILLDLTVGSSWIVRHMARMSPTILVPVAPDMNSVISLQSIENFFHGMVDADGRPLQPYYLINQFDVSLPLHLDVREVLRRQLGDRLLPFVIHRAPEVSEALAEGMTVVDYAPDSPVSGDYMNVATWLRTIAAPAAAGFRNVRWSER